VVTHKIAVLPGDGIGPEIVDQGIKVLKALEKVLDATFELEYADIGGAALETSGIPLPESTLKLSLEADAVYLGAVGDYKWDTIEPERRPEQGLLQIRKAMELYANLRPVKAYHPLLHASTLKPEVVDGIDIMVVRELTGGLYFGKPRLKEATKAYDTMLYTKEEVERIAHVGFKMAQKRSNRLTSVDKANVLASSQLWRETVEEVAKQYADVELSHMYVDNASMQLIRNPKQFDVLLTENTFGDILSDEASMLTGSLGMLASASLGEHNRAMYEPSHGSAPKYAGLNKVNPIATIMSAAMMLEHSFGYSQAAQWVDDAVLKTLLEGYRTYDIAEPGAKVVGTSEIGDEIVRQLLSICQGKADQTCQTR
jgi:3-isopropylmalate dehydrogenase